MDTVRHGKLTLVVRKPSFGLPTGCPKCLSAYIYLKFAKVPFDLEFNPLHPDSDQIPYVEYGDCVAYSNEKCGVIEGLKEDGVVNLDSRVEFEPEWLSTNAMIASWLSDAVLYELWVASDESPVHEIYYSDLAWPTGKILFVQKVRAVRQLLGINGENADRREAEIYQKATLAYRALSTKLGDEIFFFDNRPTSLDANFLAHVLFTLQALPETSRLRAKLLEHSNIVSYAEKHRNDLLNSDPTSAPQSHSDSSSSVPKSNWSSWKSKTTSKPKREKTEEEKTFRRRAKYFLGAQFVAVLVFLSLMAGSDDAEVELDEGDETGYSY